MVRELLRRSAEASPAVDNDALAGDETRSW
jgi:hypothetical protein